MDCLSFEYKKATHVLLSPGTWHRIRRGSLTFGQLYELRIVGFTYIDEKTGARITGALEAFWAIWVDPESEQGPSG